MNIKKTFKFSFGEDINADSKTPSEKVNNCDQETKPRKRSNSFEQKIESNRSFEDFSPFFKPPTPDPLDIAFIPNIELESKNSIINEFSPLSIIEFDGNLLGNAREFGGEGIGEKVNQVKEIQEYFELDSSWSKSSLELVLYRNQIEEIYSNVLKKLGPHKNGCDILKGLKRLILDNGIQKRKTVKEYFLNEFSDFYDYYYMRELELIVMDFYMK